MVEILNNIILALFTLGLGMAFFAIGKRLYEYNLEKIKPPLLAFRDFALIGGLAVPFFLIFLFRAFQLTSLAVGTIWWTLITGVPAVAGVLQWVYIEYFVIEKKDSRGYLRYMEKYDEDDPTHNE